MSMTGSKGGIYASNTDLRGNQISTVLYWQAVGKREMRGSDLYQKLLLQARPIQLEIGIGNECGMNCKHCYLAYPPGSMEMPLISIPNLQNTVAEMVEKLGTRMICVSDRDALTLGRSIPFFQHLADLRRQVPDLKFGGVTNGLRMPELAKELAQLRLDYLDISIDGLQHEHDNIRGAGRFTKAINNLRLAKKHQVAERIIATHTLTRYNDDSLLYLIQKLIIQEKMEWFDIGPFMAVASKMMKHQLQASDIAIFLESLFNVLQPLEVDHPVTILLELCAYCAAFLPALVDKEWLIPEQIQQDKYGHLYQVIPVNSSIKIILRPELISEYWRHTLRISADGYVIGGCEPLTRSSYSDLSVGNIQHNSITSLYKKALAPQSPFHLATLSLDHNTCRHKTCFQHCLGGDSLLAKAVYNNYNQKDPNCIWDHYVAKSRIDVSDAMSSCESVNNV